MYLTFKNLQGFSVKTFEQDIVGHVRSFYIDEETWTVRYISIDTILSPDKKSAVIAPSAIDRLMPAERMITLSLKTGHIQNSPAADDIMPLSREKEIEFSERYEWPAYWTNLSATTPGVVEELATSAPPEESRTLDNHLRDFEKMITYNLMAQGKNVGVVDDFIVDHTTWHTAFVIVDSSPLLPGRRVMLPPRVIAEIDSTQKSILADVTTESIKKAPAFEDGTLENLQTENE